MKYLIPSDRAYTVIYNYLVDNYTPDYGWAETSFYKKEIERFGIYIFYINENEEVAKISKASLQQKSVGVDYYVDDHLTPIFGNLWQDVFVDWFRENSGLDIVKMTIY